MAYPRFVAQMAEPSHRARLRAGVTSGYVVAIGFLALAFVLYSLGVRVA